jgi:hypothetical protein
MANALTGPTLMFNHCLDELKGWPDEAALDFDAHLAGPGVGGVNVDPVYGGSCVHVNPAGAFVLGVGPADMAIFLLQGSHELDVNNFGGTEWYPIAPTGKMSGLVAAGGFELETTEFYFGPLVGGLPPTAPALGMYTPGMQLTSPLETNITGTDLTAAGKLFKSRAWPGGSAAAVANKTDPVCAVVSRTNHVNHHRVPVLSFWPVYLPTTG